MTRKIECGSLRHSEWASKGPISPGETFPLGTKLVVEGRPIKGKIVWNKSPSHARSENISKWNSWKRGTLDVSSYTEKGTNFPCAGGIEILAVLGNYQTNIVVLTRPAKTSIEKKAHHRHPVLSKAA